MASPSCWKRGVNFFDVILVKGCLYCVYYIGYVLKEIESSGILSVLVKFCLYRRIYHNDCSSKCFGSGKN